MKIRKNESFSNQNNVESDIDIDISEMDIYSESESEFESKSESETEAKSVELHRLTNKQHLDFFKEFFPKNLEDNKCLPYLGLLRSSEFMEIDTESIQFDENSFKDILNELTATIKHHDILRYFYLKLKKKYKKLKKKLEIKSNIIKKLSEITKVITMITFFYLIIKFRKSLSFLVGSC